MLQKKKLTILKNSKQTRENFEIIFGKFRINFVQILEKLVKNFEKLFINIWETYQGRFKNILNKF